MSASSPSFRDPNTLSNHWEIKTVHTDLNVSLDFSRKIVKGDVVLTMEVTAEDGVNKVVLDTSFLKIDDVKVGGQEVKWEVEERKEPYGSALKVELPQGGRGKGEKVKVSVGFETTEKCTALQWMEPSMTGNGKAPYMCEYS